jgi:hypothetical protein
MITVIGFSAQAQEKAKSEVKATSTPVQKVHNTFSKHKHHKGYKTKHKDADGTKHTKNVNYKKGVVRKKDKID